jgi:hypothetical protein
LSKKTSSQRAPHSTASGALILLSLALSFVGAREARAENALWSAGSAYTSPSGRTEVNLTTPSLYALSNEAELFIDLPLMALTPNIGYKRAWPGAFARANAPLAVSTRHRASTPSLLRGISTVGENPFLLTLESDLLLSARVGPRASILTFSAGGSWTPHAGREVAFADEWAVIAPRVGNAPWVMRGRLRWDAWLAGQMYYFLDTQLFVLPAVEFAQIEQRVEVSWRWRRVKFGAGVMALWSVDKKGARSLSALPTLDAGVAID